MYVVRWDDHPPEDKADWLAILKEVFLGAPGTYWVRFYRSVQGWRFDVEQRDVGEEEGTVIANSPDSIRFLVYHTLKERGKPMDPGWRD